MKENGNPILDKSFEYAVNVIKLVKKIQNNKKEFVITKQLIRSGTSIGANSEEAVAAESTNDFLHKFKIARKEARESKYWLRLLATTGYIENNYLINETEELIKILTSIILTTERNKHS